jgi:hypothetical protein
MQQVSRLGRLTQAEKTYRERFNETLKVFKDKGALFVGFFKTSAAIQEERKSEFDGIENSPVTTTVDEKFDHFNEALKNYVNDSVAIDATNQTIKVDVVVDNVKVFTGLPITTVIHLKTKVIPELIALYKEIPTTSTGLDWKEDSAQRKGIYVADAPMRFRSEKQKTYTVAVQPTQYHPAQIFPDVKDLNVATITEKKFSGEYTPLQKAQKLAKLDKLLAAFTVAAGDGNTVKSEDFDIAAPLLSYLS